MKEPLWIDERDALALHGRLIGLEGGAPGVRDVGLLQSALARPRRLLVYIDKPHVAAMSGACIAGIVRNHPFVDGNKHTGFLVGILFLEVNGYRFTAIEQSSTQVILSLVKRTLDESTLVDWLRKNSKRGRG